MIYSGLFYALQRRGSRRSAEVILPILFDEKSPSSIIDVGCGIGTWLVVAQQLGAPTVCGLEGEWVLSLPKAGPKVDIRAADLERPLSVDRRFDLAICMEVAEHLSPDRAESFVEDLCALSDSVLFSAAIPWQGGVGHLNEQPQSYWARLFAKHGFGARDIIRPKVWHDGRVSYWYRQNSILYERGVATAPGLLIDRKHPIHFISPWRIVEAWDRLRGRNGTAKPIGATA